MRCTCCDRLLNDFESTRKSKSTGEYLDMCNRCYSLVQADVQVEEREDLEAFDVPDDEMEFLEDQSNDWDDNE